MMRTIITIIFILCITLSCSKSYRPDELLSELEIDSLLTDLVIYMDKLQAGATLTTRFNEPFRNVYKQRKILFSLERYFIDKKNVHYFMVLRVVPSLYEANKRAVVGRFRKDENGKIVDFEEIALTPVLSDEEALEKGNALFNECIATGSLGQFRNDCTYVEYPNLTWQYNKQKQAWINVALDSLLREGN